MSDHEKERTPDEPVTAVSDTHQGVAPMPDEPEAPKKDRGDEVPDDVGFEKGQPGGRPTAAPAEEQTRGRERR